MADDWEPHIKRRDTAWVQGELATDFDHFPRGMQRLPLDARYYLTTPEDFRTIVEEMVVDYRNYRKDKFDCENFALAFNHVCDSRDGLNSVGLVIDYDEKQAYNIVVYEDGTTELFEPQSDEFVVAGGTLSGHEAYTMDDGFILL
jgi:hypothetical protein